MGNSMDDIHEKVKAVLQTGKGVTIEQALEVLRTANLQESSPATLRFVEESFHRLVCLITQISPLKMGVLEKNHMEEFLTQASKLCLKYIARVPMLVQTVAKIFDGKMPFYIGSKTLYRPVPGSPHVRIALAKGFADAMGFHHIASLVEDESLLPWFGAETAAVLLNIVNHTEVLLVLGPSNVPQRLLHSVVQRLLALPDEQLKRENLEMLGVLLAALNRHTPVEEEEKCLLCWFELVHKCIQSSSLVVRLFGWDQLGEIIDQAKLERPFPLKYEVIGAGTSMVNGVYTIDHAHSLSHGPQYVKHAPGLPDLTIMRCTMKNNKNKWWFIMQADKDSPGTEKDIDYYLHRSTYDQERQPPLSGWINFQQGLGLKGQYPAPTLVPHGYVLEEGVAREECIDMRFLQMCIARNLHTAAFNLSSIHREVISRSAALLHYLCEYDALSESMLETIWSAALESSDVDIYEEILALLVTLSRSLSESRFAHVVSLARDSLARARTPSAAAGSLSPNAHNAHTAVEAKVTSFVEKFAVDDYKAVSALSPAMLSAFLSLAWEVYSPLLQSAELTKSGVIIQELLAHCFKTTIGCELVLEKVQHAKSELEAFVSDPQTENAAAVVTDESRVNQALQTLSFLVSRCESARLSNTLEAFRVDLALQAEIVRFIRAARAQRKLLPAENSGYNNTTTNNNNNALYRANLRKRFQVLHKCASAVLVRDAYLIFSLWELVSEVSEVMSEEDTHVYVLDLEEFLFFLRGDSDRFDSLLEREDTERLFEEILCSDRLPWAQLSELAFECFRRYFVLLESWSNSFPSPRAMDTLWRICLTISSQTGAHEAIGLLLRAYETLLTHDRDATMSLLNAVFDKFQSFLREQQSPNKREEAEDVATLTTNKLVLKRCVMIAELALKKFEKSSPSSSYSSNYSSDNANANSLSHFARGCMHRLFVNVHYRRHYGTQSSAMVADSWRNVGTAANKSDGGSARLEVHPFHTVKMLKEKLIDVADLSSNVVITIEPPLFARVPLSSPAQITDNMRLYELGVFDNCDLWTAYQVSYSSSVNTSRYYENDLDQTTDDITGRYGDEREDAISFAQQLASDVEKFDCLLSLLQVTSTSMHAAGDAEITRSLWNLLMSLPTQPELADFVESSIREHKASFWSTVLSDSSLARTTYLLQIVDNLLQPAPELEALKMLSDDFKQGVLRTEGLAACLKILIATSTEDALLSSVCMGVALHVVFNLLFAQQEGGNNDDDNDDDNIDNKASKTANTNISLSGIDTDLSLYLSDTESITLLEKLLFFVRWSASQGDPYQVQSALLLTMMLIRAPAVAAHFIATDQSKTFLLSVLRSNVKPVRESACNFAVQVGRQQPVVMEWLLEELEALRGDDAHCGETFFALSSLLQSAGPHSDTSRENEQDKALVINKLAKICSAKLLVFRDSPQQCMPVPNVMEEQHALVGFLELLDVLIALDASAVKTTDFGRDLVQIVMHDFLFGHDEHGALCCTPHARQAAFRVLSAVARSSQDAFESILQYLSQLSRSAAKHMQHHWNLQVAYDMRKPDTKFSGLKNQGCTCYMNSLLQLLFMSAKFRDAVLKTPIKECFRNTLWHRDPVDLVGEEVLFEWHNNAWRVGKLVGYEAETGLHRVQYTRTDGSAEELAVFNIHEGRPQRETGRVKLVSALSHSTESDSSELSSESDKENESDSDSFKASEEELAAYAVLEQLQRTFCYLKSSKKRFFDPRPLVDACKTLNLSYNIYQQNDASEFCDKLLDRIETATKGKHTRLNMWNEVFLKEIFGGEWITQKIPRDCEAYTHDKTTCGHWQGSRKESFLKIELMIRGKESIHDSLKELVQGELMDGDNKIHCDVCDEKKATMRRSNIFSLPNTLILHLKRFDLDFQTFETVKLNSRMEFPQRINMLQYTKEGIEAAERAAAAAEQQQQGEDANAHTHTCEEKEKVQLEYQSSNEDLFQAQAEDYEYELQGVLVHAGVAQGGHYYSFVKDANSDQWFRFDDDEVTPFDAEHIAAQCYGGSSAYSADVYQTQTLEDDRTSNALVLFYNKINSSSSPVHFPRSSTSANDDNSSNTDVKNTPRESEAEKKRETQTAVINAKPAKAAKKGNYDLIDGLAAFEREVRESNSQHLQSVYLIDPELHVFVRSLLSMMHCHAPSSSPAQASLTNTEEESDDVPLRTVQFATHFLLDVALHCRERPAVRQTVSVLRESFERFPHTAEWFVGQCVNVDTCAWFTDFLVSCFDPLARATFAQLLTHAVAAIAPKDTSFRQEYRGVSIAQIRQLALTCRNAKCELLVRLIVESVFRAVAHVRVSDELFLLIRDLAMIPGLAAMLRESSVISYLSYFLMPDDVSPFVQKIFEKHLPVSHYNNTKYSTASTQSARASDFSSLHQSVFEAIAALLGVPQLRKVNLLVEKSFWDHELAPEAREALTQIFYESALNGVMDQFAISQYLDKVLQSTGMKATNAMVRQILDRFSSSSDGKVHLEGFLNYQQEMASYNPKQVWRDLTAFGYRNDLSRKAPKTSTAATGSSIAAALAATADTVSAEDERETEPRINPLAVLPENCRACLLQLQFYEVGIFAAEAAAKAILQAVCRDCPEDSHSLLRQALTKLHNVVMDGAWNNNAVAILSDFFRLILSFDDGHQAQRVEFLLLCPHTGLCGVILSENRFPSKVRANDYNPMEVLDRYRSIVEDLITVDGVRRCVDDLAASSADVKAMRGLLRLTPGSKLTFDQETTARETVVVVEGAGTEEVNGEYTFKNFKNNAGYYGKTGTFGGNPAHYTLYKCSMKNGGFQWFISITPPREEPGTTKDIDFYYENGKAAEFMPPLQWRKCGSDVAQEPAPMVRFVGPTGEDVDTPSPPLDVNDMMDYDSESDIDNYQDANLNYNNVDESFTSLYSDNE